MMGGVSIWQYLLSGLLQWVMMSLFTAFSAGFIWMLGA
jgi:hypothetical protein